MKAIDKAIKSCDMSIFTNDAYNNRISFDDLKITFHRTMENINLVPVLIGQLKELEMDYNKDISNNKLDKNETRKHYKEYRDLVERYKNSKMGSDYSNAIKSFLSTVK